MAIEDNILDTEFHQSHIVENSIRFAHFIIDTITRFIVTISFVVFVGFFHNITSFNININCVYSVFSILSINGILLWKNGS